MACSVDKHFELQTMGQRTEKLEQRGKEALCAILNDVQHYIYHATMQNLDVIGMKSCVLYSCCFLKG